VEWTGHACIVAGEVEMNAEAATSPKICGQKPAPHPLTNPTPSPYNLV